MRPAQRVHSGTSATVLGSQRRSNLRISASKARARWLIEFLISAGISAHDLPGTDPHTGRSRRSSSTGAASVVAKPPFPAGAVSNSPGSSPYSTASKPFGRRLTPQQNFARGAPAEYRSAEPAAGSGSRCHRRSYPPSAPRKYRGAVEHIHRQAGIISNSDQASCLGNSARLQQGVLSEGHAGLGNIGCVHTGGVNYLGINVQAINASAQNFAQFLELASYCGFAGTIFASAIVSPYRRN